MNALFDKYNRKIEGRAFADEDNEKEKLQKTSTSFINNRKMTLHCV